ncbi:hypothetical protein MJO28_015973 [Puccinia striiformis f. sp. tritici]|uniref:DNA-directed RNA polymerase III subunit RPC3 n=2 Tax=Puccinia striiformis f. sp. tritici TaxID=168172 RepID=A0A0L0VCP5_9BASI|nr:hypothetical protein Pst134EA_029002 [Puccinia striiformis f. sp. tritici]KAH9441049.1 hypothetical protein Pst134EB_029700 [Puccinia striiformis f. sp. tritici]KAH9447016.1 hypothetical protein Pst134EA_029002 [Puccinia striiformis f. sp. tritici]KAI7937074.1 hypothetical protein MJO28_015973 [Puccinia striiformis f. sp. tritici]KNE97067.1 hypothetical protein PSTG_09641 [Puccinia striiformis f. sp. tritici PST-78]
MKSLSPQDIRLCEHILTQLYGHACGEIGSILLNRGRLPFSNLLRMSCLTGNSVRTALIVLIQQNCVLHSDTSLLTSTKLSTGETHGPEYFEAIPEEILTRIRFGQYINIAYGRFGIESKLIVECLLDNGKLRVGQLVTLVCDQYLHSQSRQKFDLDTDNLYDLSPLKLPQIVKSNVFNLLAERYIRPAHPKHTINPTDLALAYEKQIIAQLPGVPTPKDIRAAKEKVEEMMTTEEDEGFEELCSFEQKQRALNQNDRNPKRQKTGEVSLEDDMFVRVNYARFNIKIRNSIFEQESLRSFNLEAGLVMRAMLILAESKQKDCSDLVSDPISAQSILMKLGSQSNIVKTCFPTRAANGQFNLKLKNTGDLVAEMLSVMAKQDDLATSTTSVYTPGSLDKGLTQLNPLAIVSEKKNNVLGGGSGSGGMREFKIEYARFSLELRKTLVARIIREKFGIEAARVVRILMHKGRLDEKHLAKFAMMTLKDSRELCLKLSAGKVIELQEIPKTNDRQPSRTFYLFFIDFQKLILNLTIMIRKSQTNLIIRIDQELKLKKTLISKINRSDVIHDQDGLLTVWERADIKKLNTLIQVLEVAKLRLERDLFILNDLPWLQ